MIKITRASEARDTTGKLYNSAQKVTEPILYSQFAHRTLSLLTPPGGIYPDLPGVGEQETGLPNDPRILDYFDILARAKDMGNTYPDLSYEIIGGSYTGATIAGLVYHDERPLVIFDVGVHGNEAINTTAVLDILQLMLDGDSDPVLAYARDNLGFLVILGHNADGMIRSEIDPDGDGRNTGNPVVHIDGTTGINMNRNYDNYHDVIKDLDKGTTPRSEPESQNIVAWLLVNNRIERVVFYTQIHGWESRPNEGYLTEWQLHDPRSMRIVRSTYLHAKHRIDTRDYSAYTLNHTMTFSGLAGGNFIPATLGDPFLTITGGTSGATAQVTDQELYGSPTTSGTLFIRNIANGPFTNGEAITSGGVSATLTSANSQRVPRLKKFNSKMKPYAAEFIWNRTKRPAACGLFEYSEQERSWGFTNLVTLDYLHGCIAGACEGIISEFTGILATPAYPQPLNNNSDFADWHSTQPRPQWMSISGGIGIHYPSGIPGDSRPFVNLLRPVDSNWPGARYRGAGAYAHKATLKYDAQTANFTVGKILTGGTSGCKAYILADADDGTTGTLTLTQIRGGTTGENGLFEDNETVTDSVTGSATANGVLMPDANNAFFLYGGRDAQNLTATGYKEAEVNSQTSLLIAPPINSASNPPEALQHAELAYDGTYLYLVGGHDGGSDAAGYRAEIYRALAADEAAVPTAGSGWTLWHTLTTNEVYFDWSEGIQRHTAEVWHDTAANISYLLIIGGRNFTDSYTDRILRVRLDTKAESVLGITLTEAVGYHTSWLVQDRNELYIAGGYDGMNVEDTVYRVDLATPAFVATTALIGNRRRQAVGVDWENSIAYLFGGEQDDESDPPDIRSNIWKYDFSVSGSETCTDTDYEVDDTGIDDHGDPIVVTRPELMDVRGWVNRHDYADDEDNCFVIVGGADDTEVPTDQIYEYDIGSNVLYLRKTNNNRWLYTRARQRFTGSPGDQFVNVACVRSRMPQRDTRVPYVRPTAITNPLNAIERILRHQYAVPPRIGQPAGWTSMTYPFRLQAVSSAIVDANETEWRAYLRHYGDNTDVDVSFLQAVKAQYCIAPLPMTAKLNYDAGTAAFTAGQTLTDGTTNATATIDAVSGTTATGTLTLSQITGQFGDNNAITDPLGGSATADGVANAKLADTLTEVFATPVATSADGVRRADIAFCPCFGSQMQVTSTLFNFTLTGGLDITNLNLQWVSTENFTANEQITPTIYAQEPSGKFVLNYTDAGGAGSQDMLDGVELNWLRAVTTWVRDVPHIRVESNGRAGTLTVKLWFYGLTASKTLSGTGEVTGYTVDCSQASTGGAIYSETQESSFGLPLPPDWFKRLGKEKNEWRRE